MTKLKFGITWLVTMTFLGLSLPLFAEGPAAPAVGAEKNKDDDSLQAPPAADASRILQDPGSLVGWYVGLTGVGAFSASQAIAAFFKRGMVTKKELEANNRKMTEYIELRSRNRDPEARAEACKLAVAVAPAGKKLLYFWTGTTIVAFGGVAGVHIYSVTIKGETPEETKLRESLTHQQNIAKNVADKAIDEKKESEILPVVKALHSETGMAKTEPVFSAMLKLLRDARTITLIARNLSNNSLQPKWKGVVPADIIKSGAIDILKDPKKEEELRLILDKAMVEIAEERNKKGQATKLEEFAAPSEAMLTQVYEKAFEMSLGKNEKMPASFLAKQTLESFQTGKSK